MAAPGLSGHHCPARTFISRAFATVQAVLVEENLCSHCGCPWFRVEVSSSFAQPATRPVLSRLVTNQDIEYTGIAGNSPEIALSVQDSGATLGGLVF